MMRIILVSAAVELDPLKSFIYHSKFQNVILEFLYVYLMKNFENVINNNTNGCSRTVIIAPSLLSTRTFFIDFDKAEMRMLW